MPSFPRPLTQADIDALYKRTLDAEDHLRTEVRSNQALQSINDAAAAINDGMQISRLRAELGAVQVAAEIAIKAAQQAAEVIKARDATIANLRSIIDKRDRGLASLQEKLQARDQTIADLKAQVKVCESLIRD